MPLTYGYSIDRVSDDSSHLGHSRNSGSGSPLLRSPEGLAQQASSSSMPSDVAFAHPDPDFVSQEQALQTSRMSLLRAQKDTQDAFMKYTSCLDIERQARQAVTSAEKRRDDISVYNFICCEF